LHERVKPVWQNDEMRKEKDCVALSEADSS
jgi:hypothetical protein